MSDHHLSTDYTEPELPQTNGQMSDNHYSTSDANGLKIKEEEPMCPIHIDQEEVVTIGCKSVDDSNVSALELQLVHHSNDKMPIAQIDYATGDNLDNEQEQMIANDNDKYQDITEEEMITNEDVMNQKNDINERIVEQNQYNACDSSNKSTEEPKKLMTTQIEVSNDITEDEEQEVLNRKKIEAIQLARYIRRQREMEAMKKRIYQEKMEKKIRIAKLIVNKRMKKIKMKEIGDKETDDMDSDQKKSSEEPKNKRKRNLSPLVNMFIELPFVCHFEFYYNDKKFEFKVEKQKNKKKFMKTMFGLWPKIIGMCRQFIIKENVNFLTKFWSKKIGRKLQFFDEQKKEFVKVTSLKEEKMILGNRAKFRSFLSKKQIKSKDSPIDYHLELSDELSDWSDATN